MYALGEFPDCLDNIHTNVTKPRTFKILSWPIPFVPSLGRRTEFRDRAVRNTGLQTLQGYTCVHNLHLHPRLRTHAHYTCDQCFTCLSATAQWLSARAVLKKKSNFEPSSGGARL